MLSSRVLPKYTGMDQSRLKSTSGNESNGVCLVVPNCLSSSSVSFKRSHLPRRSPVTDTASRLFSSSSALPLLFLNGPVCIGSKQVPNMSGRARLELFTSMEVYYNRVRRHSTLGYVSPLHYEQKGNQQVQRDVCFFGLMFERLFFSRLCQLLLLTTKS